jgi:deoxyribonuclease V
MILAFDTYYFGDKAKTVCIAFNAWSDADVCGLFEETLSGIEDYEPGAFYKRELPCILSLIQKIDLAPVEAVIVDGFVVLDDFGKIGLGGHLFEQLGGRVPVIGVAKSGFHNNKKNVAEAFRGDSKKPLYITAKGIGLDQARQHVASMHGKFRMPNLLKLLDAKTKEKTIPNCDVL